MKITLNRYMTNRTYTHGLLTIGGKTFETLEKAMPWDKASYVKHCLPAGIYPLRIESSLIELGEGTVRRPWMFFDRVKWFPKAALITTHFDDSVMLPGRIFVGSSSADEWSVEENEKVTAQIIASLLPVYDASQDEATEPIGLVITESPDMTWHDYTYDQYQRELRAEQELRERQEAERRLQELMAEMDDYED